MRTAGLVKLSALAVALAVVLAGCGPPPRLTTGVTPPDPPPVPRRKPAYEGPVSAAAAAVELAAPLTPQRHEVVAGDTVFRIARAHGVPIRGLIDANALVPPYRLRPGQVLRIPALRLHVVAPGDTVYGISRRYGIDMTELVGLNEIAPPFRIPVGLQLILPNPVAPSPPSATRIQEAARPVAPSPPPPAGPRRNRYGVVIPPRKPLEGQSRPIQTRPAPPPPAPARAARPDPAPQTVSRRGPIPEPPPRAGSRFLWPVEGRITLGFGPKEGGLHNDGINIAAPLGAPIVAAENGVVAYAGNELRGFGNLILIKHADGWVTAYAHAQRLLVGRGAQVKRGQTIARVGSTGSVATPQLHFEIRKGAQTVDPLRHLARRAAAAKG